MNHVLRRMVLVLAPFLASASFLESTVLGSTNPVPVNTKYASPSGQFVLRIHPSNSYGKGGADYHMLRDDKQVWDRRLPFTLFDARLLNDGTVVGYAYTLGADGIGGEYPSNHGDLVIAILDPQGNVRVKEAYQRSFGPYVITTQRPEPQVDAIVVDPDNNRVIFLVTSNRYQFAKPATTAWRQFELSTGKALGIFYPEEQMEDHRWLGLCQEVQPLPGTPLLVAQWHRIEGGFSLENLPTYGAHFAVLDEKHNPVWQLTLRDDYEVPGNEERKKKLSSWIMENGAILSVNKPGRFDLYFAKKGQRVSFATRQDEQGKWIVTEIGRKDFTPQALVVPPENANQPKP